MLKKKNENANKSLRPRKAVLIKKHFWSNETVHGEDGARYIIQWNDALFDTAEAAQQEFYKQYGEGELVILEQLKNGQWQKIKNVEQS
jgi:hypothetical protein